MLQADGHELVANQRIIVLAGALFALAGCAPLQRESAAPPPPPPQLLGAEAFELPAGCEPITGQVYRTNFVVQRDGRVTDASSGHGEGCVEQALRNWVSSFRYGPIDAQTPVVMDWLAVTATRGG